MAASPLKSRRDLLLGLAGLGAIAYGWQLYIRRARDPEYTGIPGLPDWRQVTFDGITAPGGNAIAAVLVGIGDDAPPVTPLPPERLPDVLYKNDGDGTPLAVFSDFFCPYCRRLTQRLAGRSDVAITWHELPLLGPASEIAARAGIAADLQGGYPAFQSRLMATPFRPSPQFLAGIARASGLDGDRLLADMDGQTVADRLGETRRAAATLGIYGTPAMTLARTLVMGEVSDATLGRLIAVAS